MSGLYVVERIIGKRIRDGKNVEFKVKWKGYDSSQSTWEPIRNLKNVDYMIDEFEQRNKDKLPPSTKLAVQPKSNKFGTILQKKIQSKNIASKTPSVSLKIHQQKPPKKKYERSVRRTEQKTINKRRGKTNDTDEQQSIKSAKDDQQDNQIVIESAGQNQQNGETQQNGENEEQIEDIDLDNIATKIMEAMSEKQKKVNIVGVIKGTLGEGIMYVTEDSEGHRQTQQRQFVLKNLSAELIAFYESQVQLNQRTQ